MTTVCDSCITELDDEIEYADLDPDSVVEMLVIYGGEIADHDCENVTVGPDANCQCGCNGDRVTVTTRDMVNRFAAILVPPGRSEYDD